MFDRFGEFDSAKGINETAVNLRREGDNDSIYALARENGIDREMVDAFVAGDILYICDAMSAAIGKISVEEQELKPKEIMADWTEYIRSEAFEDESMAIAVRRKGKSLKGCIAEILKWAFAHQTEISPETGSVTYQVNGVEAPGRPDIFASDHIRYNGVEYRRNTAVKAYLLLGADTHGDLDDLAPGDPYAENATDAIFLIAHDTAGNAVRVIQIPRDTMTLINTVDTKGQIDGQVIDHLSRAWAYGDGADFSGQLSMQAVSWLFAGLPIDGYFAGSMDLITNLNDFVGGVPVTVRDAYMSKADPRFVQGQTVTLQGDLAEKFVRYRDITEDYTAITRMDRQRQYAIAFSNVLLSEQKKDNQTIPKMFQLIQDHVETSMSKGEYLKTALDMASSGPLEDSDFEMVPGKSGQGEEINPDTNESQVYDQFYPDDSGLDQLILTDFYRNVG